MCCRLLRDRNLTKDEFERGNLLAASADDHVLDGSVLYLDDPRLKGLVGPGAPYELKRIEVDGVVLRTFKNAPRSIVDVFKTGKAHDELTHLVFEGERITFGEMRVRALSFARELRSGFGIQPGDHVAISMRNLPEFMYAFWGAVVSGAVVVPLNSWWVGPELSYGLQDCGAKVVVTDEERAKRLAEVGHEGPVIAARTTPGLHGSIAMDALINGDPLVESELAEPDPDDLTLIVYTSGTTGHPKGTLITHRALIVSLMSSALCLERGAIISPLPTATETPTPKQPAVVVASPLFHIGGPDMMVRGFMAGMKIVLMQRWDAVRAIELSEAEDATGLRGVPTMARDLLYSPRLDPSKLDIDSFSSGGAAVQPDLPRRALELFGSSIQIVSGYGATETTSSVAVNVGDEWASHLDSVGRPTAVTDVQVQDDAGTPLPVDEVGELCFRTIQNSSGYLNLPEATASAFADGWYHTGDLGYVDGEGYLYVVDRLKDMVIRGGENVYSAEVEAAIVEHPDVLDVAIIGLPEERLGECVCAVVVQRSGTEIALDDIREFTSSRLAYFKRPEALFIAEELPRTASAKTDKLTLRANVLDAADRIERID